MLDVLYHNRCCKRGILMSRSLENVEAGFIRHGPVCDEIQCSCH